VGLFGPYGGTVWTVGWTLWYWCRNVRTLLTHLNSANLSRSEVSGCHTYPPVLSSSISPLRTVLTFEQLTIVYCYACGNYIPRLVFFSNFRIQDVVLGLSPNVLPAPYSSNFCVPSGCSRLVIVTQMGIIKPCQWKWPHVEY